MAENRTIQEQVAGLYNRFPYPNYPLLARPRWQDGYLTSSYFSGRLIENQSSTVEGIQKSQSRAPTARGPVLVAGCGEILPYIIRKWEPSQFPVVNVDLSSRSLTRGRIRTAFSRGKSQFVKSDIVDFLNACDSEGKQFAHIETFGMLHHMGDPAPAIQSFHRQLLPGGTVRAMVYNSPARDWIHALQDYFRDVFAAIGTSSFGRQPDANENPCADLVSQVAMARQVLADFANQSPLLAERLRAVGKSTLNNPARLADTFLHPHELRWPLEKWFQMFADVGFVLAGIFDRYGELDDLPNPLFSTGKLQSLLTKLSERVADRRFEGNLETIWVKPFTQQHSPKASSMRRTAQHLSRLKFRMPPVLWFDFEETRHLAMSCRMRIWHAFLDGSALPPSAWGHNSRALQRLARLGAVMPDQLEPPHGKTALAPMTASMTPPDLPRHADLRAPNALQQFFNREALKQEMEAALAALNQKLGTA